MTNTENETYAKYLEPGSVFYANGVWETVESVHASNPGVWVYARSGEAYYYLGYTTVTLLPLTSTL